MKSKITKKNVLAFIQGNYAYYYDKLFGIPPHIKEQVLYRYSICTDCIKQEACQYCTCDPIKKAFNTESCNGGERFPDLMDDEKWEEFKKENNVGQ